MQRECYIFFFVLIAQLIFLYLSKICLFSSYALSLSPSARWVLILRWNLYRFNWLYSFRRLEYCLWISTTLKRCFSLIMNISLRRLCFSSNILKCPEFEYLSDVREFVILHDLADDIQFGKIDNSCYYHHRVTLLVHL